MSIQIKGTLRYVLILTGLFFMANGTVLTVEAQLGVAPWNVLHLGITSQTGITLGRVTQLMGLLLVLISWVFHIAPSVVTVINMFFVGYFIDLVNTLGYIPAPEAQWEKALFYLSGVAFFGFGTALYMSSNRGAGPRDNLMLALTKITKRRIGTVRTVMEVAVAVIGYLLGGPLGLGTVLFALLVGVFLELGFAGISFIKTTGLFRAVWQEVPGTLVKTGDRASGQ